MEKDHLYKQLQIYDSPIIKASGKPLGTKHYAHILLSGKSNNKLLA